MLLTEAKADINTIKKAIENRNTCMIFYQGDEDGVAPGWRRIEPYVLGVISGKNGHIGIRAWLVGGTSGTPPKPNDSLTRKPGWRMYRLDRIKNIVINKDDIFNTKPSFIRTKRPKYNPNDKDMTTIYMSIPLSEPKIIPDKPYIPEPFKNKEEEPKPYIPEPFRNKGLNEEIDLNKNLLILLREAKDKNSIFIQKMNKLMLI
jgi:hypothetical protein